MSKPNYINFHSNNRQLALQIWCLTKVRTRPAGRIGDFGIFSSFSLKAQNYYPAYHIGADFSD